MLIFFKMKRNILLALFSMFVFCACGKQNNEYLLAGSGFGKIIKVNREGKILWEHELGEKQECNSVSSLGDGKILYSFKKGAKAVDADHNILWSYKAPEGTEVQSAVLLEDGNYLIGQCGNPSKIMEFTPEGKMVKEIAFETGIEKPHGQFRRLIKMKNGNYLVGLLAKKKAVEIDSEGNMIKMFDVNAVPFAIAELANGNWLVSGGDRHDMSEIDSKDGHLINKIVDGDLSIPFRFVAQIKELPSGNRIICNWGGHAKKGQDKVAQIFEIDTNNKVLWSIDDWTNIGKISAMDIVK